MSEEVRLRKVATYQHRLKQAGLDGGFAATRGRPATDNPHRPGTELHKLWGDGWREARDARRRGTGHPD